MNSGTDKVMGIAKNVTDSVMRWSGSVQLLCLTCLPTSRVERLGCILHLHKQLNSFTSEGVGEVQAISLFQHHTHIECLPQLT